MQGVRACHARVPPQLPTQQPRHRSRNHVALRSTKGKSMNDIVNTLRQRRHNVTGGNPLIEPFKGPTMFSEAADEIERLREERDEARREVCKLTGGWITRYGQEPQRLAIERGWDCFKEDGK